MRKCERETQVASKFGTIKIKNRTKNVTVIKNTKQKPKKVYKRKKFAFQLIFFSKYVNDSKSKKGTC